MLPGRGWRSWRPWIAVGQLLLVAGLLGGWLVRPETDFWAGFGLGLVTTLLVASAAFNLRGLVLLRRARS